MRIGSRAFFMFPGERKIQAIRFAAFIGVFAAGFLLHEFFPLFLPSGAFTVANDTALRERGKYQLVDPLLLCGADDKNFPEDTALEANIKNLVDAEIQSGAATDVSVYFRDFRGHWVGVHEYDKYDPASLLKVPIMIAYYKAAETNPNMLSQTLTYDGSTDANRAETFRSMSDIQPGVYTVDNLIKSMIINSDNNAEALLYANIDKNSLTEVYTDLDLPVPPTREGSVDFISAKAYSNLFRVLYNGTYLTPSYSEKALELLAGPDFPQGIRSTVPAAYTVAQKFGERSVFTASGAVIGRELHDCGIVYYAHQPYLLCIMTKGSDFKSLLGVIQTISKTIFDQVR